MLVMTGMWHIPLSLAQQRPGDTNYNGLDHDDVPVTNMDDDVAGIDVGPIAEIPQRQAETSLR